MVLDFSCLTCFAYHDVLKTFIRKDICNPMLTVALFTVGKTTETT